MSNGRARHQPHPGQVIGCRAGSAVVRRRLHLSPVPYAERTARSFITSACASWGLSHDLTDRVVLAVSELASNAIEHAGTQFTVYARYGQHRFYVAVQDRSPELPVLRAPSTVSARGRGVALVAALADYWGVAAGPCGKLVWARITTPCAGAPPDGDEADCLRAA
jgi:hypothetical protein